MIPEVWNGKNVADYIDPDIMAKLDALEKEEELRDKSGFYESEESESETEEMKEIREMASKIRVKKKIMKMDQKIDGTKKPTLPRTATAAKRSRYYMPLGGILYAFSFESSIVLDNCQLPDHRNFLRCSILLCVFFWS